MKKPLLLLVCILLLLVSIRAQYVAIPDANFRAFLKSKYPSCFNGAEMMDTTCIEILNEDSLGSNDPGPDKLFNVSNLDGIQYFKSLKYLNCNNNPLSHLPSLPPTLVSLRCSICQLTDLPSLPPALIGLDCSENQLVSLPPLPASLQGIGCGFNQLVVLPPLPASLQSLDCRSNQLTSLPALPASLQMLYCFSNKLTALPLLPSSITNLSCGGNKLVTMPDLPVLLKAFDCAGNLLNELPPLPASLLSLYCGDNLLTTLPAFPLKLRTIDCARNYLTKLSPLPDTLDGLNCSINPITALPALPNSLWRLQVYSTNITCLPVLPNDLYQIDLDSSIQCLPNLSQFHIFNYSAANYVALPICNATNNPNGCTALPVIEGTVFYDYDKNGIKDNNEVYRSGARVVSSRGVYSFTNDKGFYQISADTTGPAALSISATPYSIANPVSVNFDFNTYDTTVVQNFTIQPDIIKDSLSITATPVMARARPGYNVPYTITYQNEGTTNLQPTIQLHFDDQLLTYDSSSNLAVSRAGNTLTLNDPSLPYGSRGQFTAYFTVKSTAPLGDTICAEAAAKAATANATTNACIMISGSFDPNDKQSTPIISPEQVSKGGYINYTIRFQNTGNDTAFAVVIADTLSDKLQTNTLQMLCASHLCKATVKGGIAYFEFLNIQLPDSNVNEPASHGFVQFRVKPQSNLTLNSQVENKSYIYFDYNAPVLTNTAITIIKDLPLPISLLSFTGSLQGNQTNLYWQTASEINFSRFEVERSIDGIAYNKIGTTAAKGNGDKNNYSFIDSRLATHDSRLYYRLKIIDKDGSSSYSAVVLVIFNKDKFSISISPNPGKGKFSIQLFNWNSSSGSVRIADMNGRIVYQKESIGRNVSTLPIDIQSLAKGIYMATIEGEGQKMVQKVLIE